MNLPPRPCNIGKRRRITSIDGVTNWFVIDDEVVVPQGDGTKLVYFQRFRWEHDQSTEYRLTYYMLGVKPGRKGQWVFGQYSTIVPADVLSAVLKEARARGWDGI